MLLIFTFIQDNQKWKVATKYKMNNLWFVDQETIKLAQDENYDDYNIPNTSKVDQTPFTGPDVTDATSNLQLRQKVKQDKITALCKHLNVTSDPGLADIVQFMIEKYFKTANTELLF